MDQTDALDLLKSGSNVFLTGSAGTGKTYVINEYVKYLHVRQVAVAVTASTGIAATHIGGQTIHSWSGIGIREQVTKANLLALDKNINLKKRLTEVQVLVIDEISMLSGNVLAGVSQILQHFKRNDAPFGGIQIVTSGDFFQLPPVYKTKVPPKEKFAFMHPIWVNTNLKICYLHHQYRQKDERLSQILQSIRNRIVNDSVTEALNERLTDDQSAAPVKLFTHNMDVDQINAEKLVQLDGKVEVFEAQTKGNKKLVESLRNSVLAAPTLQLKAGARVMFVRNSTERKYFNGTLGTVLSFGDQRYPIVGTDTGEEIVVKPEEWTINDEKEKVLASYKQFPLRLAWAITVHKSQGMTLDAAEIDLSRTFEPGQGYVALSRLKSLDQLYLRGINKMSLEIENLAFKADKRFQELSGEAVSQLHALEKEAITISHLDFIDQCGGTNDPELIERNTRKSRSKAGGAKQNTFERTKSMIEEGKSLEEIAFDRGLTEGTIISHLQKIKKEHPEFDLSAFRPSQRDITAVEKTMNKIKASGQEELLDSAGEVKLSAIHRGLNGRLDYEEIRLARMFVG